MVLLTMTPAIVEALQHRKKNARVDDPAVENEEPSLEDPAVGKPISHGQIVELWKELRGKKQELETGRVDYSLELLLCGSTVYIPPPPPKPEPSAEYKALMARLRREEEERTYQRMATRTLPTFAQQFPASSLASQFADIHRPSTRADEGDDDVTLDDVHRQVMLVINFLVTILGCAATLWVLGRWWSTPARLFLTLGGSIVVGIAEVGVYQAYLWHLGQAKKKDGKQKEVKSVVETWIVGKEQAAPEGESVSVDADVSNEHGVRHRKGTRRDET